MGSGEEPWLPCGSQVESSLDVEVGVLADALALESLSILGVNELPSLVLAVVSGVDADLLALSILGLGDFDDFASSVHEELALKSEDLPPSAGSASDLQGSAATVTLDVEGLLVLLAEDCSGLVVEVPNLVLTA